MTSQLDYSLTRGVKKWEWVILLLSKSTNSFYLPRICRVEAPHVGMHDHRMLCRLAWGLNSFSFVSIKWMEKSNCFNSHIQLFALSTQ